MFLNKLAPYAVLVLLWSGHAVAYDCRDLANDLFSHMGRSGNKRLTVEMSASKVRSGGSLHSSYGRNVLSTSSQPSQEFSINLDVAFSDRGNFSTSRRDRQRITFFKSGLVEVTLLTWGNTSLWLEDTSCYEPGIITGIKREGNGLSQVTISVTKG